MFRVDFDRDGISHRARRHKKRGFLAEDSGGALLE
jgi:hypothetical protein